MKNNDFGLFIVATPIGNLKDISERAIDTISDADLIICENPKHSLKLLNKLGIKKKLISLHDYNENMVIERVSLDLNQKKIALISDAGSPLISDPGFKLVQHCIKNAVKITSIPGSSSLLPALQLSGLPINQFYFAGFFPKTKSQMLDFFKDIKNINKTSVFFVSSHKIQKCLELIEAEFASNLISVSKELTKLNEKVFYGLGKDLKSIILKEKSNLKGEFVIVVEGNSLKKTQTNNLEDFNYQINKLLKKFSLTDVVEIVHKLTNIKKNTVYKWVLNLKKS